MLEVYFSGVNEVHTSLLLGARSIAELKDRSARTIRPQGVLVASGEQAWPHLHLDRDAVPGKGFFVELPDGFKTWLFCNGEEFQEIFGESNLELISQLSGGVVDGIARLADTKIEMGKIGHIRVR